MKSLPYFMFPYTPIINYIFFFKIVYGLERIEDDLGYALTQYTRIRMVTLFFKSRQAESY